MVRLSVRTAMAQVPEMVYTPSSMTMVSPGWTEATALKSSGNVETSIVSAMVFCSHPEISQAADLGPV
ncbi:MAG: hypothetical protein GY850_42375 [bacterium]|nr:hypothetical protein [bacterium]